MFMEKLWETLKYDYNFYIPYTFYANRISSSSSTIGLLNLQLKIVKK